MNFKQFVLELETKIINSYSGEISLNEAEKLAAEFLGAQLRVSTELKKVSLDASMRKSGLKAVKAAVYLDEAKKGDKKPSDVMLNALVDSSELVLAEQKDFDAAEIERDELERLYSIFREAHVYYRGVAKGVQG